MPTTSAARPIARTRPVAMMAVAGHAELAVVADRSARPTGRVRGCAAVVTPVAPVDSASVRQPKMGPAWCASMALPAAVTMIAPSAHPATSVQRTSLVVVGALISPTIAVPPADSDRHRCHMSLGHPSTAPVLAQQDDRVANCSEKRIVDRVHIGHDCGEFASVLIAGNVVIQRPWSRVNRASRAERIRLRQGGAVATPPAVAPSVSTQRVLFGLLWAQEP